MVVITMGGIIKGEWAGGQIGQNVYVIPNPNLGPM
jgi:hypothetical protein